MLLRRLSTFILVGAVMTMLQGCGESGPTTGPSSPSPDSVNPANKAPAKSGDKAK